MRAMALLRRRSRLALQADRRLYKAVAKNNGSPADAAADAATLLDGWEADLEGLVERGAVRGVLSGWVNVGHGRILVRYWQARQAGQDAVRAGLGDCSPCRDLGQGGVGRSLQDTLQDIKDPFKGAHRGG